MKKYLFDYYGFIPSYGDFDQNWIEIEANSEEEAWEKFNKSVRFVKSVSCKEIKN